MDVEWLQRDLGLYVVNMFDTSQASRVLGLVRHSLAYLLKLYCNVEADKEYQLADWRIRFVFFSLFSLIFKYVQFKMYIVRALWHIFLSAITSKKRDLTFSLPYSLFRSREKTRSSFPLPLPLPRLRPTLHPSLLQHSVTQKYPF